MKKIYSLLAVAALAMAAFACAREVLPEETEVPAGGEEPEVTLVTYTLRTSQEMKASLNDESGAFTWAEGDKIAVYDATTKQIYTFTGKNDEESSSFVFSAPLPARDPEDDYQFTRAWSPSTLVGDDEVKGTISLPSSYDYDAVKDATSIALVANVNKSSATAEDAGELQFSHMAAIVRLTINNVPEGGSTLTFSSPDVQLCGDFALSESAIFNASGEGVTDGDGHDIVKSGYDDPRFVDEIKAAEGSSAIEVKINMESAGTAVVYLPVPTGTYNYNITLTPDGFDSPILSKGTSSAKAIKRADFLKMAALSASASPATKMRLRGNYIYGGTTYNFPTSEAAGALLFQPLHSGWYKVSRLRFYNSGEDRRIRFKMCILKDDGTSIKTHYHINTSEQRGNIPGVIMPVAEGGGNDANIFVPNYPDDAEFTVYYNIEEGKVFIQESSLPFVVPSATMSYVDQYAHIFLDGEVSPDHSLQTVPGQAAWRAVYNVPAGKEILFKKPKAYNADGSALIGAATSGNHELGRFIDAGTGAFSFTENVDVYISTDATTIFALPAGSAFAVPTQAEGAEAMGKTEFLKNTAYGVYNLQGVYTGSFEPKDQTIVAGSTVTLVKGWTFDEYVVEGVPSSASVGDEVALTVKYVNNLTAAVRTATINAEVLSVASDKIVLYDESADVGVIVRPANSDSGAALAMSSRPYSKPDVVPDDAAKLRQYRVGTASVKIPVVLLDFKDKHFTSATANADFSALFNGNETFTNSVKKYYKDNSGNAVTYQFDVYGPVSVAGTFDNVEYDGTSSALAGDKFTIAVCNALKNLDAEVDFTQYGFNNSFYGNQMTGRLITVFPGASSQTGGSFTAKFDTKFGCTVDGVLFDAYAATPELESIGGNQVGIGHAAHEFGHALGIPDWYNISNQLYKPVYTYSLMDFGDYNNYSKTPPSLSAVERVLTGYNTNDALNLISTSGRKTLNRMGGSNSGDFAFLIPTEKSGEAFVCEFRSEDTYWDSALPGNGMLVFHVDASSRMVQLKDKDGNNSTYDLASALWSSGWGNINSNSDHPLYYLVNAANQSSLNCNGYSSGIPFPGSGNVTRYNPVSWADMTSYVSITDIPAVTSGESMSFNAHVRDFPVINDPKHGKYSSGDKLYLELSQCAKDCSDTVSWSVNGESKSTGSLVTLSSGRTHIVANLGGKQHIYLDITVE